MSQRTPLQRHLAGEPDVQRPTALDAFKLARADFLAGQRIDLGSIASRLGVSRVTLYRWVGTREQLLVEVIWSLTERTMDNLWERLEPMPGPRVPDLVGGLLHAVWDQPGSRVFLERENALAMSLLTLSVHGFQPRMLDYITAKVADDIATERVHSVLPLDDLAYTVLRVAESFHYLPTITGEAADPDRAIRVLKAILQPRLPQPCRRWQR